MSEFPSDAENVTEAPYDGHDCCCGNPLCRDFEQRMEEWGIPLNEITTVTFTTKLE